MSTRRQNCFLQTLIVAHDFTNRLIHFRSLSLEIFCKLDLIFCNVSHDFSCKYFRIYTNPKYQKQCVSTQAIHIKSIIARFVGVAGVLWVSAEKCQADSSSNYGCTDSRWDHYPLPNPFQQICSQLDVSECGKILDLGDNLITTYVVIESAEVKNC